ncbi:AraC family transcriptional regulator [Vibrio sp. HN007]|uniref:AraC family transcriptional regulator n=1 Tax=Vibrio iocasae TaxID=3098914 RepID=UPI0035D4E0D3
MVENNQHKYLEKESICAQNLFPMEHENSASALNYSRTLGQSKNWIGSGYIEENGTGNVHIDGRFPFYSVVYVVHGEGEYIDKDGNSYPLRSGSIFQRLPQIKHTTYITEGTGWKEYYLDCNEELYEHLCSLLLVDKSIPVYQREVAEPVIASIKSFMEELQTGTEEQVFDAYLSYLNILRTLFTRQDEDIIPDAMIKESLENFERLYPTRFDLKEYCKDKGWGYEKFRKTFKKHLGVSPREYLIRKRMNEACRLLRATNLRISEISTKLGYASQYEFSNQFNKYFSVAPKHYREGI